MTMGDKLIRTDVQDDPMARLPSLDYTLFGLRVELQMSKKLLTYKRAAYTILDLFGDFGGF